MLRLQLGETVQTAARRSRVARVVVHHPRLSAAVLLVLLVGLSVLAHVLFGHGHRWHGERFGAGLYGPDQGSAR